jgi:hypothetical protein
MRLWPSVRHAATVIAAALVIVVAGLQSLPAQQPQRPTVSDFLANPGRLLQLYPNGGPGMIAEVRDLAVSDRATLQPILNLLANADKYQKIAFGRGLADAARILVRSGQQAYATEIQEAILKTKDQDVVLAFTIASGNRELGTTGGGAGGGGGASGGQTNAFGQTGGANSGGTTAAATTSPTGSSSTGGGGTSGGGGGGGSSTLSSSGSP